MHHHNRTESEVPHMLAAREKHDDLHPGRGVITPTHDQIALRAYEIYVKNGRNEGHRNQDWEQAEHELRAGRPQTMI
jgi:DUF2934 family protein